MYRHRVDPDRAEIKLVVDGDPQELLIAPMLLIPFIENSFKHGLMGTQDLRFVDIHMEISGDRLQFSIHNSRGENARNELEQHTGIGIDNTRQRLELLYPGQHKLDIETQVNTFTVNLSLELKQQ
jgi:LytS/YehU family sensor histidine kinase